MIWSKLSEKDQAHIIGCVRAGVDVEELALQYDLKSSSLERTLRKLRREGVLLQSSSQRGNQKVKKLYIDTPKKIMIYSDTHFGVHDPLALRATTIIGKLFSPDILINLGDTLEADSASRFGSDPESCSPQEQREAWAEFDEELTEEAQPTHKYIIAGNHDVRYKKLIMDISAFDDIEEFSLNKILYADELGYEDVYDLIEINPGVDDLYPAAMLYLMHGSRANKHSGVSSRNTSTDMGYVSLVMGHAHRTAMSIRRTDRGLVKMFECGCLRNLTPGWMDFADWSQSVIIGLVDYGTFDLHHVIIDRGSFIYNGTKYEKR